jgi:hypothetical protein
MVHEAATRERTQGELVDAWNLPLDMKKIN